MMVTAMVVPPVVVRPPSGPSARRSPRPDVGFAWINVPFMGAVLSTFRTAMRDAWATRRSFWVRVSVRVANGLAWVVFWVLFFQQVGSLRGWDANRTLLLFSILCTTAGISLGLLANARR